MAFIQIGSNGNDLTISIPTKRTKDWADQLKTDAWQKIVDHDHSGLGKGKQLGPGSFVDNAVNDLKIRLRNNEPLRARNAANDGDIDILKINASDVLEFIAPISIADDTVSTAKIQDNAITNAKMADNSVDTIEIVDDAVTTAKIADGAITNDKASLNQFLSPGAAPSGVIDLTITDQTVIQIASDNGAPTYVLRENVKYVFVINAFNVLYLEAGTRKITISGSTSIEVYFASGQFIYNTLSHTVSAGTAI